jgi:hypothetical protein
VPGVDPADRDGVEQEAERKEQGRDATLVLLVIEPEALEIQ